MRETLHAAHSDYAIAGLLLPRVLPHIRLVTYLCNHPRRRLTMRFLAQLFPRPVSRADAEMAYLRAAANRYDLEMREREIANGKFAGY